MPGRPKCSGGTYHKSRRTHVPKPSPLLAACLESSPSIELNWSSVGAHCTAPKCSARQSHILIVAPDVGDQQLAAGRPALGRVRCMYPSCRTQSSFRTARCCRKSMQSAVPGHTERPVGGLNPCSWSAHRHVQYCTHLNSHLPDLFMLFMYFIVSVTSQLLSFQREISTASIISPRLHDGNPNDPNERSRFYRSNAGS